MGNQLEEDPIFSLWADPWPGQLLAERELAPFALKQSAGRDLGASRAERQTVGRDTCNFLAQVLDLSLYVSSPWSTPPESTSCLLLGPHIALNRP